MAVFSDPHSASMVTAVHDATNTKNNICSSNNKKYCNRICLNIKNNRSQSIYSCCLKTNYEQLIFVTIIINLTVFILYSNLNNLIY